MAPSFLQVSQITAFFVTLGLALALATTNDLIPNSWMPFKRSAATPQCSSDCRCFPGDECWPTTAEWQHFNHTLGGKLVATTPIGSPCHQDQFEAYNKDECAKLQNNWGFPSTHIDSSSSVMATFFANQSCDPFLPKSAECVVGSYISYAVNATDASDFKKTIKFTTDKNIRLTVRNTGHDYYGKSTGAGAVGIWTRHLRDIKVVNYKSPYYTGKALKLGAGVEVVEAYEAAEKEGLVVVGGNCPSVGIAGGYSMGGGHGPLASKWGLAADSVLEWEVVTGTGEHLVATPSQHSDLYWGLTGGGGSTFGVVLSMTTKAHPDETTATETMSFTSEGVSMDTFYDAVNTFIANLPRVIDVGAVSIWLLLPGIFMLAPTTAPGVSKAQLQDLMQPVYAKLNESKIKYVDSVEEFPTYLASYNSVNQPYNISEYTMGGRLIQRTTVEYNSEALTQALRTINEKGAVVSGVSFNTPVRDGNAANSVNPALRNSVFDAVLGLPYNNTDMAYNLQQQDIMTSELMPLLETLTPGGGSYLSEGDFRQPDFQQVFYGTNYERLLALKHKYDPNSIFYAVTGVGSEFYTTAPDGRLCKVL